MQTDLKKFATNITLPFQQLEKNSFVAVYAVKQVVNSFEALKKVKLHLKNKNPR